MANKTVENPCLGSGFPTTGEVQTIKNKTYAECGVCNKLVSVNKANRNARKHTGIYQPTLWEAFEEEDRGNDQD